MAFSIELLSPNFASRAGRSIDTLIIRSFKGTAKECLDLFLHPKSEDSANYVIDGKGSVYSLVNEENAALNVGFSFWRGESEVNKSAISIAIANTLEECPKAQTDALLSLAQEISAKYGIPAYNVVSDNDIAFLSCPFSTPIIPWKMLAEYNIGIWISDDSNHGTDGNILNILDSIGYQVNIPNYKLAKNAFCNHYCPSCREDDEEAIMRMANAVLDSIKKQV